MHYFALAQLRSTDLCATDAGEPLCGATVTTERGLTRHYLVEAVSHRAADYALVVELPLTRDEVEAALARSLHDVFPEWGPDPEDLAEIRELLDLAAEWPVTQAMAAGLLAPVTTAMLRAFAPAEALS
ncbi:hypothetical protein [Deinococcus sp. Leaf326]|uniref:hypothetical protein n=1 Tax=Deinococcus sp. Leaf326 TaxID=1736338 RepID=UPI0006FBF129|nr:hypothetical protein [Deinococcus sp. Leaf326]KQR18875.1 hypothetical protein ASF71_19785 [Deinococcus sp. Leaf326]